MGADRRTRRRFIQVTFEQFLKVSWLITVGYAMAVGADGILAVSLLNVVRKSRQNFKREEPSLDIAVVYIINTGLLTSILSILSLIFVGVEAAAPLCVDLKLTARFCADRPF